MLRRTEGIVLRTHPYGEADLIVTYLTKDFGITKAFAKSPRKTRSRFGSSLEPCTHAQVSLMGKEDAALPRLTQSDIMDTFQGLREGLGCFTRVSAILELTVACLPEQQPNHRAYSVLLRSLRMMEADCSEILALACRIKLLAAAGYAPRLKGCARCGREGLWFFMSHGSVVCAECAPKTDTGHRDGYISLTAGSVKLYETLLHWGLTKTARVKASAAMLRELGAMLEAHVEYTLAKPLKTRGANIS